MKAQSTNIPENWKHRLKIVFSFLCQEISRYFKFQAILLIFARMVISENVLKWALRLYPPFLFQRIWVESFFSDFMGVRVKISKSILNKNYNGSIFGGSIFSASDPFYAILFHQVLNRKGFRTRIWLKSASIEYLKPARTNLYFQVMLSVDDIKEVELALNGTGKFIKSYPLELFDSGGELCAQVMNEVYIRNLDSNRDQTIAY